MERDLHTSRGCRDIYREITLIFMEGDLKKNTYIHDKRLVRGNHIHEKGPICMKRDPYTWKDAVT